MVLEMIGSVESAVVDLDSDEHQATINVSTCMRGSTVMLYTGTRLYRNTGFVASISELVFPLLSIR